MSDTLANPGATPPQPPQPPQPRPRRWLRRALAALAVLLVLLAAALWLLGRESTLQQIVQRVSAASGGQIAVTGVTGSLYGRMHIDRIVSRSPESVLTAKDVTIDWSPAQIFSSGIAISELHIVSVVLETLKPGEPAKLPLSLAPPFPLSVADARLDKLTLLNKGVANDITGIRLKLSGDKTAWRVQDATALTQVGRVDATATVGAQRPFALDGKASLTQTTGIAAGAKAAQLAMTARGNLSLFELAAQGTSANASGDALLTLAPFDAIILRAADIKGRGIDPSLFNPAWPKADLSLQVLAKIDARQNVSGQLSVLNNSPSGSLDSQRLPLHSVAGRLGGTLTATTIDGVLIDLGAAGRFAGGGRIQRAAPDAGIDAATFLLRTEKLDLHAIHGSIKPTRIVGDISVGSTGNTQTLTVSLAQAGLRLDAQATLADAMLRVKQARIVAGKGNINLSAEASLKDEQAFKAAINVARFDPSALGAYPVADLNAGINAAGKLTPSWQVAADFTLRPSRIFGQPLTGSGTLQADARGGLKAGEAGKAGLPHISGADVKLALGRNTVEARGGFGAPGERLQWRVNAPQLSAASSDLLGALAASGVASGTFESPRSSFDADAKGLGLASAKRPVPDSVLHAAGEVRLTGAKGDAEITLAGNALRFNPAAFGDYPTGSINGDFSGSGKLAADWRARLDLKLLPSTLSGAPLTGYAKLSADHTHVDNADIDLHLGPNSAQAKGGFGGSRDQLDWKIDAPQLGSLGPDFGGVLRGSGVLTGSADKPALSFKLDGADLRLLKLHQIKALRASGSLGSGLGGADPLVSDIDVTAYSSPTLTIDRVRLQTGGTRAAHTVQLSATSKDFDALARVRGGWVNGVWTGEVEALQNKGRFALSLQAPAPLRLAGAPGSGVMGLASPEQIALSNAVIRLPDGSIRLEYLEKNGARWRSKGQAAGVPVSYLAQLSDVWRNNIVSDLTLGAGWALDMQAPQAKGAAPALDGMLNVFREKGDITVTSGEKPIALGLSKLEARANVAGNALRVQLELNGARAGQARLEATTQLANGRVANDSALAMTGSVDIASLAWLAPLAGVEGLELDGALKVAVSGSGTIGAPVLNGDVAGERLVVNWAEQGIKLRNGQLQARLAGDQLQLQRLSFDGGQGRAQADGWVRFANAEATMQLKLMADKLEVLARPDRTLVLSGESTLVRDARHFQLDGKFRADRASIELASENTPTISDDVVVLGRTKPADKARATAQSLPLNIDVEADLGNAFRLRGKGLDAQLAGTVRVRIADRRPPRANGSIRVVSGTYAAYGQRLAIERGVLNFTGAYDNPGLNILAVRKRPEGEQLTETNVEAGVEVRGTALAPQAKLVSTPNVPDSDKLSWLVLGHGLEDAAGNEMALLGTAAGALFGGSGGGNFANKLGLDELGLGQAQNGTQAKGLESTVVTVGKRLSSRAYLSFEQGAGTATSLVKLRYKLNPRITLQFQTGTNNALDVLYTWAFD